jgi:hypothetical protein
MKKASKLHTLALKLGKDPKAAIARLIQGALLFAFGSLILLLSDRVITPSIAQETIALFGLAISAIGLIWAMVGYLSMSVLRIYHMLNHKD